jgi:N-carbamoylputrescine amidase
MPVVTLGLIQMRCSVDPGENLARAITQVESAARGGAQIVCLPELFRFRYFCQTEDPAHFELAEPIPGPSTLALGQVAAAHQIALVVPVFERRAEGVYHNTAVVLDEAGAELGRYRKMHVPDDPLYHEKFHFTPGDLGFRSLSTRTARLGVLICWDQWFPEAARLTALAGAQILLYPTAIGWQFDEGPEVDAAQHDAWETIQRSHAIANGVFVAAVNRVGREPPMEPSGSTGTASGDPGGIRFWGQSFVVDPFGRMLARASDCEEELLLVQCDLSAVEKVRRDWPFLRDRRIDAYDDLLRRLRD